MPAKSIAVLLGNAVFLSGAAAAQDTRLQARIGGLELRANGAISVQGAAYEAPETDLSEQDGEWDASAILNGEYVADNGLVWGVRAEFDTGGRQAEDLQRDEIYAYVAGAFGRVEIGEQDGAADTIALRAPVVGLGQVRGDFARYAGTTALLTPFDTRDALKAVYLSPPQDGLRFGVSYAPVVESNSSDPLPRRRTRQENGVELAVAYQFPLGEWALSASGAYVAAEADALTERADINSWSTGFEIRRGGIAIGGAYVARGDSNSLIVGLDEDEINLGVAWREEGWGVALSGALTRSSVEDRQLIGLGGFFDITQWLVLRGDVVAIEQQPALGQDRNGLVGLAEIAVRF